MRLSSYATAASFVLGLGACTGQMADSPTDLASGHGEGDTILDRYAASMAGVELLDIEQPIDEKRTLFIKELEPGVLIAQVEGEQGAEAVGETDSGSMVDLYLKAAGDQVDEAIAAKIADAESRAEELAVLLEQSPPPAEDDVALDEESVEGEQKYANGNWCISASSYWTNWFHNAKCTNGADFGWGWNIDRWAPVCEYGAKTYYNLNRAWFVVNFDGNGTYSSPCNDAYVKYRYWTGSYWRQSSSYTIHKGYWNAWYRTHRYQQWSLDGDNGQCRQTQLYACMLSK